MATISINYKGVNLDIEYSYEPGQKQYFNCKEGYGDPGIQAHVEEIIEIKHHGVCFLELLEDQDEELKAVIFDKLHEDNF